MNTNGLLLRRIIFSLFFYSSFLLFSGNENSDLTSRMRGDGMMFTPNKGQIIDTEGHLRPDILFKGQTSSMDVYLRKTGISYVINKAQEPDEENHNPADPPAIKNLNVKSHRIDVDFYGCNPNPEVITSGLVEGITNYYLPHCAQGIVNVLSYNVITIKNIYNNIDIKYYGGKEQGLKYDIIVRPGGNPADIKLKYSGAEQLKTENNKLKIIHSLGETTEQMPRVYQNINGKIVDVSAEYNLRQSILDFKLSKYNPEFPLIIDPWLTHYGGSNWERCGSIATDANGDVIVTGNTWSLNFPVSAGAAQATNGGATWDGLVVKFTNAGARVFATYFGGNGADFTNGVDVDNANNIYVTGGTASNNLPTVNWAGAYNQAAYAGGTGFPDGDAFIVKYTSAGAITWLTYYGGSGNDEGFDIKIDNVGNIILVGGTYSTNIPAPSAFQAANGGSRDGFITKFNNVGAIQWGTYMGGTDVDVTVGVDVDAAGNIFTCGITNSANFPVVAAHQALIGAGGSSDGFVAKSNAATGATLWATFYGDNGFGGDILHAVVVDGAGNVYAGGRTSSAANIATPGAFQTVKLGSYDAMIIKFNNAGTLLWATYFGGSAGLHEYVSGLACDAKDNLVVCGDTYSSDIPVTTCSYKTTFAASESQFFAVFTPAGGLMCSGMLGNAGGGDKETWEGRGGSVAVHGCYLFVNMMSDGCRYTTFGSPFQSTCGGQLDISVAKLYIYTCGGANTTTADFSASPTSFCPGKSTNFTPSYTACDTADVQYEWSFPGGSPASSTASHPSVTYLLPGTFNVQLIFTNQCKRDTVLKNAYINVSPAFTASVNPVHVACNGNNNGNATVNPSTGGTYTYTWSNSQTTQTTTGLSPGTYTVVVSDNNNCIATQTVTITEPSVLTSSLSVVNAGCGNNNGSIIANPAGGTSGYTYSWSNTQTTQTISNLGVGSYTLILTDANGCTSLATANISAIGGGTVSITSTSLTCSGASNATATASAAGGTGPYTYSWSNGQTTTTATGLVSNTYTVTVTDASGCTSVETINISQPTPITFTTSVADDTCSQNTGAVGVIASGGTGTLTYSWNSGATTQSITGLSAGSHTLIVTDASGCTNTTSININNINGPAANAGANVTINSGDNTTLNASGGGTYAWSPSTGLSCTNCTSPVATPTTTTTYTLVVKDANDCSDTAFVTVTVLDVLCNVIEDIFIPNAFSPNNDLQNDVLKIYTNKNCIKSFRFAIYNRWGEKVFETTDIIQGWDGYYNGKLMDAAVFTYHFYAVMVDDTEVDRKGNISLIR